MTTRMICDCGRRTTRVKNNEAICDRCFRLEGSGITGGPKNESVGGKARLDRRRQRSLNRQLVPQTAK